MQLFFLGLAAGVVVSARGKSMIKTMAKGYMAMEDMTKELTADVRENIRDAVEEARHERKQGAGAQEQEGSLSQEATTVASMGPANTTVSPMEPASTEASQASSP